MWKVVVSSLFSSNDSSIYRGRSFNRRTVVYSPHFAIIPFLFADFNSSIDRSTREKKKKKKARCVERAAKGCRLARGGGGGKEGNAADDAVRVSEWISDRVNDQTSPPLPSFVYVHWVVNIFGWSPSGD